MEKPMKRVLFSLVWIFTATVICSAQTTFYFPQIADGIQADGISWKTTIFITNPGAAGAPPVDVTMEFTTSSGAPFNLSFDGSGFTSNGNTVTFSVTGGQSRKLVSKGSGPLTVGYAKVSSPGTVAGTAVFSEFGAGGGLLAEAGVPPANTFLRQAIFVDTQSGFSTGVAYANPNAGPASITLQLLNSEGAVVLPSIGRTLAGNQHTAVFVNQLFSSDVAFAGSMQIVSSVPLAAIALRVAPSGQFTTLPPVPLAAPQVQLAVFTDPDSSFMTSDIRDVQDQIVQFDITSNSLIWTADGRSFPGYPVSGNFVREDKKFQILFAKDGERRAYFTETATGTICDIEVTNGQLAIFPTNVKVPGR
jgi:hypothetical protein